MKFDFPFQRVNWITSIFLIGTALLSFTLVPWYIYRYGLNAFQIGLFLVYFISTGLSITLGYHRLLAHLAFKAKWPVKLFVLLFGSAAFQNSALDWVSDHRRHHKHVDHDDDPYNIEKGFFHAHIGWLLFKLNPEPPMDNVADLQKDALVMWQHRYTNWIGLGFGFIVPALLGYWHSGAAGALGGFLLAGVARVVFVQQMTFCINSVAHTLGKQPYSSKCSARDSGIMALFTFGEGYHNYHHEFQYDYRNGVKPWHFDPTKWTIWLLEKLGLAKDLKRISREKILLAEIREAQKQISSTLNLDLPEPLLQKLHPSVQVIKEASYNLPGYLKELQERITQQIGLSKDLFKSWRLEIRHAMYHLGQIQNAYSLISSKEYT